MQDFELLEYLIEDHRQFKHYLQSVSTASYHDRGMVWPQRPPGFELAMSCDSSLGINTIGQYAHWQHEELLPRGTSPTELCFSARPVPLFPGCLESAARSTMSRSRAESAAPNPTRLPSLLAYNHRLLPPSFLSQLPLSCKLEHTTLLPATGSSSSATPPR